MYIYTIRCQNCGTIKEVRVTSKVKRKFCSTKCAYDYRRKERHKQLFTPGDYVFDDNKN